MRKGTSLIEVLIACIVLAIVVAGFILAMLSMQTAAEEARAQAIVAAFCNYRFAEIETHDVSYIYQTYGEPQQEQITDGQGHTLLSDTVTVKVVGDDTNGDGKPDKYYGSSDLVCVQIVYQGKVMGERVFGNTDPHAADQMTPPDIFYADFSADPTGGNPPLTVQFQDLSSSATSTIVSWSWDFGDGGTSTERNPSHTYSDGTYTVTLTVTDNLGRTRTCTKTDYIVVGGVRAQFSATPTTGNSPLTVTFADSSIGAITNWRWNFGDGTTLEMDTSNYQQNVSHTYNIPGTYTVTLRVQQIENGEVKDEDTASTTITVKAVLTVKADSSDGTSAGVPSPNYGSHSYDAGATVNATCGQDPYSPQDGKRYVCLGWKLVPGRNGQPSEEGSGTSVFITMSRNYTLTWKWQLQYELTVTVDDPLGHGSVMKTPDSADGWYNAGTSVTLLATRQDEFRQWTGDASGTNPQTTVTMNSAKDITAVFNKFKLTIVTDPSGINPAVLDPPKGDNWLPGGSTTCRASLQVNISDGARYRLTSYTGTGAAPSGTVALNTTQDPYQVSFSLNKDSSLTWSYEKFYRVTASVTPAGAGTVNIQLVSGQEYTDGGEHWFKAGSSVRLTATANTHYHFVEWQEDGRTISTGATLNLNNINSARNLVAIFAKDQVTLTVKCKVDGSESSLNLDNPDPGYGDNTFGAGENVNVSVDDSDIVSGGTKYVFRGWEGNGSVKIGTRTSGSESSFSFAINMDSTLWWCWKTQYRLHLVVGVGGSVDVTVDSDTIPYAQGTYDLWFDAGKTVTLKATPSGSNQFLGWEGDYPAGQQGNQTISVTLDGAKSLTARFGVQQVWEDYFNDGDNLDSQTNTEVSGGYLQLAQQGAVVRPANCDGNYTWSWKKPPLDMYWCYHRCQAIYLASEIGRSGRIVAIEFYNGRSDFSGRSVENVTIKLKETSATHFTSYTWESSGFQTVVSSRDFSVPGGAGWKRFDFDQPFQYSGTGNLLVSTEHSTGWWDYNYCDWRRTKTSETMTKYASSDSGMPSSAQYLSYWRPNVRLVMESGGYFPQGNARTETIGGDNVVGWGNLQILADKPNNTAITVEVYNAETDDLIKSYSVEDGNNTFNLGEDVSETIKKIYLKIVLTTGDAGTTPKVDQITLTYYTAGN